MFSLIVGTLNRSVELGICLDSLLHQTIRGFEIIIVDQSDNKKTEKLVNLDKYACMDIKYYNVKFRGLSKARNFALSIASGDYFALIDDDASYDENYLKTAESVFKNYNNVILSGYMINSDGKPSFKKYKYIKNRKEMSIREIVRMAPSPGLIFPMSIYKKGLIFDENFGVGAKYGACEETDLILDSLDKGYWVIMIKDMVVTHPTTEHTFEIENDTNLKKIENYSKGFGALIIKDRLIRNSNRLFGVRIEKKIKLFIKICGLVGNENKEKAIREKRGLDIGMQEFRDNNGV